MLVKSRNIIGEEEVGGMIDEDLTAVGVRNADISVFAGATSCVLNDFPYGQFGHRFVRRDGACIYSSSLTVF